MARGLSRWLALVALLTACWLVLLHHHLPDDDAAQRRRPRPSFPSPPPPPPLPPLLTDAPALQLADAPPLQLADGEALGGPSPAVVCVLMPVRSNNLPHALRNVRAWSLERASPCQSSGAPASADLAFFHSQSLLKLESDILLCARRRRAEVVTRGAAG